MIRITKPAAPAVLTTRGALATTELRAEFLRDGAAYCAGTSTFTFDKSIYAHTDVKAELRRAQHDKCAFCEAKSMHTQHGDVEHFRPKGGFKQRPADPLRHPGYYWLAYDWDNLFLACVLCNQARKANCFPLRVQKHRASPHSTDITRESPLLISPAESPKRGITFHAETAVAVRGSARGRATIEVLGLNRSELRERRLERRVTLLALRESLTHLESVRNPPPEMQRHTANLRFLLIDAVADEAEYAAMARATLA